MFPLATGVEGIFRLSGSEKRIKELKTIFDSPDRYGKGLVWDGYTVHDAANVFRRYLNDLPEPVIPLHMYEKFREPLKGATKKTVSDGDGPVFVEDFDLDSAIEKYQMLINELPGLNRQLLLYILDLLAVFAAKSDENRMTSQNLAAVFSPGIISHPIHAMAPEEYRLNQTVLIFLIENQDHFLIGMQPPPVADASASIPETQQSNPETATTTSEAVAPAVNATVSNLITPSGTIQPGSPPTIPELHSNNAGGVEPVTEKNTHDITLPPSSIAMPVKEKNVAMPSSKVSIPVLATPSQPGDTERHDYMASPSADEQMEIPSANGLSRSKSVPSNGKSPKKLRKPRPVSGNPSAQSSQTSLSAPKS